MKRFFWTLLLPFAVVFSSCSSDDGPGFTEEQRQLIMGDTGAGVLVLGLQGPITLERDEVHSNLREMDMDNNDTVDVHIRAFEDFFGDKGLEISTPNIWTNASVAVDADGLVKPYEAGMAVKFDSETWVSVTDAPLAVFNAGEGTSTGLWNGTSNMFVAFRMQNKDTRYLAWIELSVSDYDNYSFYNYGIKIVP